MASASLPPPAMPAFAEAPDERARMGRISGALWILAAFITVANCYLPGAQHVAMGWIFGLSGAFFLYGVVSALGWLRWDRASMKLLGIGMVLTIPVVGLGIYLTGGAMSFVQPMLILTLLYAAFLPTYIALVAGFLAATWVLVGLRKRLLEAELHHRDNALRDPLTGIANRRQFDAVLKREIAVRSHLGGGRRQNDGSPLALLILDLDDFKRINDNHGHPVGDAILRQVAERAQSMLRSSDTLARIGGDEFAIVAPGVHGDAVHNLARSVCDAVGTQYSDARTPAPSASIGWAIFPEDGHDFETLLRAADERMLGSKRAIEPAAL